MSHRKNRDSKKKSLKRRDKDDDNELVKMNYHLPIGYQNIPIYKIIYDTYENDSDTNESDQQIKQYKYIFVGIRNSEIKDILVKLEKNGSLDKKDSNILEKNINNWKLQFGPIKPGYTKFIFEYIDDTVIVKHLIDRVNKLCNDNITLNNSYLWYYPLNMTLELYHKLVDYLFIDGKFDDNIKQLIVSRKFFNQRLSSLLQTNDVETLFTNDEFEYNSMIVSQKLKSLLLKSPIPLSVNHFVVNDVKLYTFNNYNPYNVKDYNYFISSEYNSYYSNNSDVIENIITYYGRINNNEIYVTTNNDIKLYLRNLGKSSNEIKNIVSYYVTDEIMKYDHYDIQLNNLLKYNYDNDVKETIMKKYLSSPINTSIKKLHFEINSEHNKEYIDLIEIYKMFRTSTLIPIVKIKNETPSFSQIKSYIPFIKSYQNDHIMKIFNNPLDKIFNEYIKFVGYYNSDVYFDIYMFKNTNLYVNLNMNSYMNPQIMKVLFKILNLFVKHIKKKVKLTTLNLINSTSLFDHSIINVPNVKLIDTSLQFKYIIDNKYVDTSKNNNLFNHITKSVRKYNYYFNIIQNVIEPNINLIYKGINDFYSERNMKRLLSDIYRKKDYLTRENKKLIAKIMSNIFLISVKDCEKFINDQNVQELKSKKVSINGISVNLNVTRNVVTINIDNVTNYRYVNKILMLINNIIYDYCSPLKKNVTSKKSNGNKLDSETSDDIDMNNVDLGDIDLGDIDIGDIDLGDIDLGDIDTNDIGDEVDNGDGGDDQEIIDIDIFKQDGKHKKLTYTQYMKIMRETMDKKLFEEDTKYVTDCGNNVMRQPYILTDNEIKAIKNPSALTGYIRYRGNNYICPRIYDVRAKQPISVEDFIKNKFRSPYSGGKAIPYDARNKFPLDNEYTVIIRKPASDIYWSKPSVEKGWPDILRGTGYDGFPGLSVIKENKHGLCRPCCFKNIPEGFVQNHMEVKHLENYKGKWKCKDVGLKGSTSDTTETTQQDDGNVNLICKLQSYIMDENSELVNCRLGLLPDNLNLILANNQALFLSSDRKRLKNNANLFLRRGVVNNKNYEYYGGGNFLECISVIRGIGNINTFKVKLVEDLTVYKFIKLNNGNLISIYRSNDLLPNKDNLPKFTDFLKENKELTFIYNIDDKTIERLHKIIKCKDELTSDSGRKYDKKEGSKGKSDKEINNINLLKKIIMLYGIFTAYDNYTKLLLSEKSHIDYKHCIDLVSKPSEFLFKTGVNIIIFNKETNQLLCNPYIDDKVEVYIILILENDKKYSLFTPIFHIMVSNGNIKSNGLIVQGKHLSDTNITNKEYQESINTRSDKIRNLAIIYKYKCVNTSLYPSTSDEIEDLTSNIKIKSQVLNINNEILFLVDNKNYLIPIYPINVLYQYVVKIQSEVEDQTIFNDVSLSEKWQYYVDFANKDYIKKYGYKYMPKHLIIDTNDNVNGIELENKLQVPVYYSKKQGNEFIELMQKKGVTIEKINIPVEYLDLKNNDMSIVSEIMQYRKIYDHIILTQLIYQDLLYQNFKYEFSSYITSDKSMITKLSKIIFSHDLDTIYKLTEQIVKFMSKYISIVDDVLDGSSRVIVKGISFGKCSNIDIKKQCNINPFCNYKNSCELRMEKKYLEIFSYMLAQDILNSNEDRYNLLSGKFIPQLLLSNKIFSYPDEYISDPDEFSDDIFNIKNSKHKSNSILIDYLNMEKDIQNITSKDIDKLGQIIKSNNSIKLDKIIDKLTELTTAYIIPETIIVATAFDKDGKYNHKMRAGTCIFPYLDTSTYKLKYNYTMNKKGMLVCPVALDDNRKPYRWGYCPEDPNITKSNKGVIDINTVGDKKEFYPGKCNIPYLLDEDGGKQLHFDCKKDMDNGLEYAWCPVKFKRGTNNFAIPIAATDPANIYRKKWKTNNMYLTKSRDMHPDFLKPEKKGYCQPPNEYKIMTKNAKQLTFDEYNPNYACNTPSKGGYKKEELYLFGLNVLHIPNTMMRNKDIIINKDTLCKMINDKYYEILNKKKELLNSKNKTNRKNKSLKKDKIINEISDINSHIDLAIKSFDPTKCIATPDRGGYNLNVIKGLAKRLGLNEKIKKKELCKLIYKAILNKKKEVSKEEKKNYGIDREYLAKMKSLSQLTH